MCRLLGWAGRQPIAVADVLGPAALADFTALSLQHSDGWGMGWWPEPLPANGSPSSERSTTRAADDPHFADLIRSIHADAAFVHLRWANTGMAVQPANTHPFVRGGMAFAHNGAIHPFDRIDEITPAGYESEVRGTTDSERYFMAIAARLDAGDTMRDAVAAVVERIFAEFLPTSLNAMLLAPDALYVVSAHDNSRAPKRDDGSGPDPNFYTLSSRVVGDSLVIASSGFAQPQADGWRPLPNMSLLRVERGTHEVSSHTLD
jgi:predicted glutamine amidotransferase